MNTDSPRSTFEFQDLAGRKIVGKLEGAETTSDAGALLLREQEHASGIIRQFATCFNDHRDASQVEHNVTALGAQRAYGLALGQEDLNDQEDSKHDRLLPMLAEEADPTGETRKRVRDRVKPPAVKCTANRI